MVNQYPHYLFVASSEGEATQNDDGEWVVPPSSRVLVGACREETNGRGSQIAAADGKYITFQSLIQLPAGTKPVAVGTPVTIADDAECKSVRVTGTCMKFDVGQLHCRLWL
jgi:hypothetical protein